MRSLVLGDTLGASQLSLLALHDIAAAFGYIDCVPASDEFAWCWWDFGTHSWVVALSRTLVEDTCSNNSGHRTFFYLAASETS